MFPLGITVELKRRKYKINLIEEVKIKRKKHYTISIAKRIFDMIEPQQALSRYSPRLTWHRHLMQIQNYFVT